MDNYGFLQDRKINNPPTVAFYDNDGEKFTIWAICRYQA